MFINKIHSPSPNRKKLLPFVLLISVLLITACSSTNVAPVTGAAPASNSTPVVKPTLAPQGSGADCQAMGNAYLSFVGEYPYLGIASDGAYASASTPGSPAYIDIPKLRSDLALLATLPDSPSFGKLKPAIAQINQFVDNVETNFKSGKKPFSNGNADGQKILDLYVKLSQPYIVLADAFQTACPNYSAPMSTPAATNDPSQPGQAGNSAVETMTAAGSSMEATITALTTAMPEPTETPTP